MDKVNAARLDAEGIREADLRHLGSRRWKRFVASLSAVERAWLGVWRGGGGCDDGAKGWVF